MSSSNSVTVSQVSDVTTVEVTTAGPQGPAASGFTFDGTNKINDSIVYYDSSSDTFKAATTTTKLTLVNGGNF